MPKSTLSIDLTQQPEELSRAETIFVVLDAAGRFVRDSVLGIAAIGVASLGGAITAYNTYTAGHPEQTEISFVDGVLSTKSTRSSSTLFLSNRIGTDRDFDLSAGVLCEKTTELSSVGVFVPMLSWARTCRPILEGDLPALEAQIRSLPAHERPARIPDIAYLPQTTRTIR